jgi:ubiquinone/menaquinone biosynthesis C-methylase UbiE
MPEPRICDYEGSEYQAEFWERGGRDYEDRAEAIALKRLLPAGGSLLLELGAGAGRNTPRYTGFQRIVLLDYSRTQLLQALGRLGRSDKYVYVAADANKLPFRDGLFEAATMIRVLHHLPDAPGALRQVRNVLAPGATFVLEFASKLNLKAILRYAMGLQPWSPYTPEPVEFAALNFDFQPSSIRRWLEQLGFDIQKTLTVSHFRMALLKRTIPVSALVAADALLQWTGALWQLTPSVFIRARVPGADPERAKMPADVSEFFRCPECGGTRLLDQTNNLECSDCGLKWGVQDGIYDFRQPVQ